MSDLRFTADARQPSVDGMLDTVSRDAAFLWQRLLWPAAAPVDDAARQGVSRLLDRWHARLGGDRDDALVRRLRWDGLELPAAREHLAAAVEPDGEPKPAWLDALEKIVEAGTCAQSGGVLLPSDSRRPVPFEDFLLPVLLVARALLAQRCGRDGTSHLLSASACMDHERQLLKQLSTLCAPTLMLEFEREQPAGAVLLQRLQGSQPPDIKTSDRRYRAFVARLLQDGGASLFRAYPVLGRLLASSLLTWVDCGAELLQRLNHDQVELSRCFASGAPLGQVVALKTSLSDPHRGGRTVAVLGFSSGLRIVYKPKNLALEQAFQDLLRWCNGHLPDRPFKLTRIVERPDHGWAEFIEHRPCANATAAQQFYQRCGMLLCLLHALRATDCHCENLIACGDHPVLVDMETLMQPETQSIEEAQAVHMPHESAQLLLFNSVLRTSMLPSWRFSADKTLAYDFSGIGGRHPQDAVQESIAWCDVNTDRMVQRAMPVAQPACGNIPMLDGAALSPNEHVDSICLGFEQMYRLLQAQMPTLLGSASPLNVLRNRQVRFLFRETQLYSDVLRRLRSPQHLRSGAAFSIELDQLSRAFLVTTDKPAFWPLLNAELRAMERLDVPMFMTGTSDEGMQLDTGPTVTLGGISRGHDDVLARLRGFGAADLALQIRVIQASLHMRVAHVARAGDVQPQQTERALAIAPQHFAAVARSIGAELQALAVGDTSGSASWFGMSFSPASDRYQLTALGDNLYDGRGGVALFLAALHRTQGVATARGLALDALQPLRSRLRTLHTPAGARWARAVGIGGGSGLGSMVYALVKVGELLGETEVVDDAARLASALTPELIEADQQFDVLGGAAGAILGLLALARSGHADGVLDLAVACGRHLLAHRQVGAGGARAWRTLGGQCLAGFSHGTAGIAYALERLYTATGERDFLAASIEGIAHERALFSAAHGNWPDLRGVSQGRAPSYLSQWCHGACGIGLARLGSASLPAGEGQQHDIDAALAVVRQGELQTMDHLCCGNFGRIETLLVAAAELNRPELATQARQQAAAVLERARLAGGFHLFANLPTSVHNPGFFQGTSGIGYQLLRLESPSLPSVLLWQ